MRRTYKSKKDTIGTLDHRDMLRNMDEKSSAFDAFYIQNLKLTKRESSCVVLPNHSSVSCSKVRKRKYVKRIVKDVEPVRQRDTMSLSAYLTPDKSIRVNKVLDPFDMLLNSSSAFQDPSKAVTENTFEKLLPKKVSKTYMKKRRTKVKKFHYSSSDSTYTGSDKENTSDHSQSNITDIRTHELLVETESKKSPKYLDESINKIVNSLSLITNFRQRGSNGSINTSYKYGKNRLSKNNQSPILQNSPLCSTPFKEKYRSASIFKFSPITQNDVNPDIVTIREEKNDSNNSIECVRKDVDVILSQEDQPSPLKKISKQNEHICSANIHEDSVQNVVEDTNNKIQHDDDSVSNTELSSYQANEPFLGFSDNISQAITNKWWQFKCLKENNSLEVEHGSLNELDLDTNKNNLDNSKSIADNSNGSNKCNTSQLSVNANNSDNESMYDTCNSEQSSEVDDYKGNREPIVAVERMNYSLFMKYYEKQQIDSQDEEISEQTDNAEFESLANDSNKEFLNSSLSTESDCLNIKPNTIVITDSSTTEDVISSNGEDEISNWEEEECISFVTTRRRKKINNDSMFIFDNSYGSSSTDCDKTVLSNIKGNLEKSELNISLNNSAEYHVNFDKYAEIGTANTDDKILRVSRSSNILRLSKSVSPENVRCELNSDGSLFQNRFSSITRISSDLPRHCDCLSPRDVTLYSLNESPSNKRISNRTTRKSSRLPIQCNFVSSANDDLKMSETSPTKRVSNMSFTKTPRMEKRSNSSGSKSNIGQDEITHKDVSESHNQTVIERKDAEIDSMDLINKSAKFPMVNSNNSWIFRESNVMNNLERSSYGGGEVKPSIVLQPGKKWERSLSIYRRMTMIDNLDQSISEDECLQKKGRKYRQSVINTMEMQEYRDSLHDSINSRRSTFISKPSRPTIKFVKDPNNISRLSINTSSVFDDLRGFLNEECDDTVIELSKLSIADSEHEATILDNFHETERVATARDYVLRRCNQTEPILFDECYPETVLKNCHKIGEGVYGEVFLWRGRDGRARVMKIVPIAGTVKVNGEDQKDFHEIISEIVIAMELSALRAPIAEIERQLDEGDDIHALDLHAIQNATDIFNEVLAVRCVFGPYPSRLLDLWELYDECKGSDNDNPAALPSDQRYIVLELANAGQDLESYQFASAQQAHALFQQIAFGLAVAEEAFQFEHRDLHWGNVLIAPTEQKFATFVLRGRAYRTARCGVAATVIDYSLSRLSLPLAADSAALYNDLATDEQLFDAVGDYQFEVYRLMRDKLGNEWKNFEPYTNILWLHYTVDKMITALRYKRTNTKIHKHYIEKLKGIKNRILEYGSAVQYVLTDI